MSLHADLFILMVIGFMPHSHFLFPDPPSELTVCEYGHPGRPSRRLLFEYSAQVVQEASSTGEYGRSIVHVVQEVLGILITLRR